MEPFFNYLNAHPVLCFVWYVLIVSAAYAVPVGVMRAWVNIWRTPRSNRRAVVTPARYGQF